MKETWVPMVCTVVIRRRLFCHSVSKNFRHGAPLEYHFREVSVGNLPEIGFTSSSSDGSMELVFVST